MPDGITIEPMAEGLLLWRCLHGGPLSRETIDRWPEDDGMPWARYRERNAPLLRMLTRTYGACAIVAREGDRIVGTLRFYPKAVLDLTDEGCFCLQQPAPYGPADGFAERELPAPSDLADRTLVVHCLQTGSPQCDENPHQRRGVGSRLVRVLVDWARTNGWERIEADAFEDLPIVYEITGSAGITFWEKLDFEVVDRYPHPHLQEPSDFTAILEDQARAHGVDPDRAKEKIVMRRSLRREDERA